MMVHLVSKGTAKAPNSIPHNIFRTFIVSSHLFCKANSFTLTFLSTRKLLMKALVIISSFPDQKQ